MASPLDGIRVLDFTRALSGPYATRMLADLGADVLKVEPPSGDITRAYGKRIAGLSGYFTTNNVGKRNVSVDTSADGTRELLASLADQAHVIVENFRPGVMDRMGLGWDVVHTRNPRLVMLSISGFGQEGPERDRMAYAPVLHAETGLLDRLAEADGRFPTDPAIAMADTFSGLHGLAGVLSALFMAERTGQGQHIDMAMINAQFSADDYVAFASEESDYFPGGGSVWDMPAGDRIIIAAQWRFLWRTVAAKYGLVDPVAGDEPSEPEATEQRKRVFQEWVRGFEDREAVIAVLDDLGLAWGNVRPYREARSGPSVAARGIIKEVDDRAGGTREVVDSPYRFSDAESGVRGPASHRGEDNRSALRDWLGLPDAEVQQLEDVGVLVRDEKNLG